MKFKKFINGILGISMIIWTVFSIFSYFVDSLGIWGAPIIYGFNHYKAKQYFYLDIWKPYDCLHEQPEILYIGASQIYRGIRPTCLYQPSKKVYNFGVDMMTLSRMRDYFKFIITKIKPEVIYLAITPNAFEENYYFFTRREDFHKERIKELTAHNCFRNNLQAVKDSLLTMDTCINTFLQSIKHKKASPLILKGWNVKVGSANYISQKSYYDHMIDSRYSNGQGNEWKYVPEAMECFKDIVLDAQKENVALIVFIPPTSVDRYACDRLLGLGAEFSKMKSMMANIVPIYDFEMISNLTIEREAYFYDAVHFRASLGEKMKPILEGKAPIEPYGYCLTPETVDAALAAEDAAWEKWKSENAEYVQALTECIESGRKPKVGDFEKYIGF